MKRRDFLCGMAAGLAVGGPALAEGVADSIVRQLKRLGFRSIVQERTLLGRVRITAQRNDGLREIIVNPNTGEILRDLWTPAGGGSGVAIIDDRGGKSGKDGNSGHGSGGDDDEDDDDDDDDDEDDDDDDDDGADDNSGSGSGNSGSGGGGDDND